VRTASERSPSKNPVIGQSLSLTVWLVALEASRPESVRSFPHHQITSFHCRLAQTLI
jgi:hypothetical protein